MEPKTPETIQIFGYTSNLRQQQQVADNQVNLVKMARQAPKPQKTNFNDRLDSLELSEKSRTNSTNHWHTMAYLCSSK